MQDRKKYLVTYFKPLPHPVLVFGVFHFTAGKYLFTTSMTLAKKLVQVAVFFERIVILMRVIISETVIPKL